ncbi:MAG: hypothetical protein ACOH2K_06810 [Burkholderiaceae bacterium]
MLELDTIDRQSVQEFSRWGNAVGKAMSLELDATAAVTAAIPAQIQKDIDAGTCQPADAQATNCQKAAIATLTLTVGAETGAAYAANPEQLALYVAAMARAGDQLATLVKTQIVAKGANHVTVLNLPDASKTPYALAQSGKSQDWISAMVKGFNLRLAAGLVGQSKVLLVDAYTFDRDQANNPRSYGFSNVTAPACADVDSDNPLLPPKNVLHSALVRNKSNLVAGVDQNYKFADTVHPTPFTNQLLAQHVSKKMVEKGWL